MTFRPLPGLTLVTVIALAILIGLGRWQYQRLGWKTQVIAEIEQAANSPAFSSIAQIVAASEAGEPIDFRRVKLTADIESSASPFMVYAPQDGRTFWRPFALLNDGSAAMPTYFAGQAVADVAKESTVVTAREGVAIAGYVRAAQPARGMAKKSNAEQNRYFGFNPVPDQNDWGQFGLTGRAHTGFYIDLVHSLEETPPQNLPVKIPEIRNSHFDYMLTWYSFALILLIIYLMIHKREGRLTFGRKD